MPWLCNVWTCLVCNETEQFDDESEEEDAVVSQVLDEIGVELDSKMAFAPTSRVATATPAAAAATPTDAEVEAMMKQLGVAT